MSGKHGKNMESSVPDTKLSEIEDPTVDSGFLSGEISAEIQPEEVRNIETGNQQEEGYMRLDSGVDLVESFSDLHIRNSNLNDLSSCKNVNKQAPVEPVQRDSQDDVWKKYFQQDEDGNT